MKTKLFSQQLLIKQIMVTVVQGSVVIKKPDTQSRTLEWSRSTDIKFQPAGPKLPTVHISQHFTFTMKNKSNIFRDLHL